VIPGLAGRMPGGERRRKGMEEKKDGGIKK
jgi:hypothetical protein